MHHLRDTTNKSINSKIVDRFSRLEESIKKEVAFENENLHSEEDQGEILEEELTEKKQLPNSNKIGV